MLLQLEALCMLWIALGYDCTRPDTSHVVSVVSRNMDHPLKIHWQVVKWIFLYLRGTLHVGLVYDKSSDISGEIVNYVDSNYVRGLNRRRSLTRYILTLNGSVIGGKATLQFTIVGLIIEAEYIAATKAAKEVIWSKSLVAILNLQ